MVGCIDLGFAGAHMASNWGGSYVGVSKALVKFAG